jgi:hypothetical protein
MSFNLLKDTRRKTIPVDFQIGTHVDPETGRPPRFVHHMEIVKDAKRLKAYADRITQAGKGTKDPDERRSLEVEALHSVWCEVTESVGPTYGEDVAALRGEELHAYFHGDTIPEETDDDERRELLEGIAEHLATAIYQWLDRLQPEPSFRLRRS